MFSLNAFAISTGLVAVAEIGDKTQLLALLLTLKFRRPWPILWGMLAATLANHAGAGAVGHYLETVLQDIAGPEMLRWGLAIGFAAMAVWALIPDKIEGEEGEVARWRRGGAFFTTLVCFFLVEMGDKTQVATVALAARFPELVSVVLGTTFGMVLANAPVIFFGNKLAAKIPLKYVRWSAAACFAALAVGAVLI
ncbi:TMEM165/GDT1 family protein [Dongia sp.]|uniref:TMEM165/GDT1 family protein n=1 Tax=Dongia sp. TaxID=1977262 RepID=UPI0037525FCE